MNGKLLMLAGLTAIVACTKSFSPLPPAEKGAVGTELKDVAKLFSELPLEPEHLDEVYSAVSGSSSNGYDEEYLMADLVNAPGTGVGAGTKARLEHRSTIRDLIEDHFAKTKGGNGSGDAQAFLDDLAKTGFQIYWPYSEDWDGETFPIITFDPGYGAETNYGYEMKIDGNGARIIDSVIVDESVAARRPVWVINRNDDSAFTPLDLISKGCESTKGAASRKLMMKSFQMLRNYDSWFGGASEFFVKCGAVNGFKASTEAEMRDYSPSVTDFVVVVKRKYVRKTIPFDVILISDFTSQLSKIAFLITEDDGGSVTSWKCSAVVKIKSKSYGFEMDIPYKEKDDIVWRGQLDASFFEEEDEVTGRFGDVMVSFALE